MVSVCFQREAVQQDEGKSPLDQLGFILSSPAGGGVRMDLWTSTACISSYFSAALAFSLGFGLASARVYSGSNVKTEQHRRHSASWWNLAAIGTSVPNCSDDFI